VNDAETAAEAFQHTIELAQKAEAWGYHRFWVSEHHGSDRVMGSSPEVLIAHLLAKTTRIRVGSGGVMLQHYSPYKVAENFNVLASLAPGRVDLGIGRGPGGMPRSTRALQQGTGDGTRPLAEKLRELEQFLHNRLEETHPLYGLRVSPVPPQPAELFLLGTTTSSAEMASSLGMPYVFAQFLNGDVATMDEAIATYYERFNTTKRQPPRAMLALSVVAADTDEEARQYASDIKMVRIRLESGRTFTVGSLAAAEEFARQAQENYTVTMHQMSVVHGSRDTVLQRLSEMQQRYQVEELLVVTAIKDILPRVQRGWRRGSWGGRGRRGGTKRPFDFPILSGRRLGLHRPRLPVGVPQLRRARQSHRHSRLPPPEGGSLTLCSFTLLPYGVWMFGGAGGPVGVRSRPLPAPWAPVFGVQGRSPWSIFFASRGT
jgi:luciferase family oxidoreductase group 1